MAFPSLNEAKINSLGARVTFTTPQYAPAVAQPISRAQYKDLIMESQKLQNSERARYSPAALMPSPAPTTLGSAPGAATLSSPELRLTHQHQTAHLSSGQNGHRAFNRHSVPAVPPLPFGDRSGLSSKAEIAPRRRTLSAPESPGVCTDGKPKLWSQ